jgi:hypothetical protein
MKIRQWEIWKAKLPDFKVDHWFVLLSGQERLDSVKLPQVNGLVCYTLRGEPLRMDVRLNSAEGFAAPTVCVCDLVFLLDKRTLYDNIGTVSWERQQQIKSKVKEVWRLF